MDHLIGQRFNLISKSEIRYVGTLHEINPEQSTIALEDVYSFGTESRKADNFIPASQQKFDYIVFRGSDVKDIKIAEEQKENKQPEQQNVLSDPAILNSSRPGQGPAPPGPPPHNRDHSPFLPPGYPPQQQFGGYYPPPPQQFGRGYGPPPGQFGPGPGFPPYGPPPPGYFGPPGQQFPQGPNHFSPPQMPIGPPGQQPPPGMQNQPHPPPGQPQGPQHTAEMPVNDKAPSKTTSKSTTPAPVVKIPTPPVQVKPPTSEALAPAPPVMAAPPSFAQAVKAPAPAPKSNKMPPAVPMQVNQKSFVPPASTTSKGPVASSAGNTAQPKPAPSAAAMEEASRSAKEAVAAALAKLNPQAATQPKPVPASNRSVVDALTKQVNEMRTTDAGPRGGRGGLRGQRGNFRGGQRKPMEIPKTDYDFESANAKFNKDDMIKEATATDSPIEETAIAQNGIDGNTNGEKRKDSLPVPAAQAYNKSSSFFDNISSEAKDREEEKQGPRGRAFRNEEFKKNYDTFGQGSVDGGGFRGRGRGFRGRGRPYGGQGRGFGGQGRGGFRGSSSAPQA